MCDRPEQSLHMSGSYGAQFQRRAGCGFRKHASCLGFCLPTNNRKEFTLNVTPTCKGPFISVTCLSRLSFPLLPAAFCPSWLVPFESGILHMCRYSFERLQVSRPSPHPYIICTSHVLFRSRFRRDCFPSRPRIASKCTTPDLGRTAVDRMDCLGSIISAVSH
jgi:hypothetical protein